MDDRYRNYHHYLRQKYRERVYRISIDGGFGCPNRLNGREGEGCIFCEAEGSRAVYLRNDNGSYPERETFVGEGEAAAGFPPLWSRASVESQVRRAVAFLQKRYQAQSFLLYFQAYSATYASTSALKVIYDHALSLERPQTPFRELVVSTRPDCIDGSKADLLADYQTQTRTVGCELGLQTASDRLLRWMHRGHTVKDFTDAYGLLTKRGIPVSVHLISGLPTETEAERQATLALIGRLRPFGVKIHNLNVVRGTSLHRLWLRQPFPVEGMEEHVETLIYYLRHLPPETLIMRMTCDTPPAIRVLPDERWIKSRLLQRLEERMAALNAVQGDRFEETLRWPCP